MAKLNPKNVGIEVIEEGEYKGEFRMHYPNGCGYSTFKTFDDLAEEMLPWIAREMRVLAKRQDELGKLMNCILNEKGE